ncbi:hypothetical protein EMPS_03444 [Entomortierella parvispora]|uniref:Uncharacterized protein n=1 Tax=Entomortierella parvispora TaxID=205924 RepID=A0A9P3LUM7_9FUNG|nr:hypothetical protein EMPS_03444 [Entomortierella parvispora]
MTSAYPHFPLLSLPVAAGLAYAPHFIKTVIVLKATGRWNNINPRGQVDKIETKLSPATLAMVRRAENAHNNGLETLSVFYGSVLAALHAGVPKDFVSYYAGLFLISRGAYNVLYILNTTPLAAGARSSAWFVCMYSCLKMFLAAAATKYY